MAKTSLVERDKKRLILIKRHHQKRIDLKALVANSDLDPKEKLQALAKLSELPRNSSPTRYRRRCQLTGRPRGTYRKFGLCRNELRRLASSGQIPGVVKASW